MAIFKWNQFLLLEDKRPKYEFDDQELESNFQEAKKAYDELYLNMSFFELEDEDPEDYAFFEFIGKTDEGWWLLTERFDAFDTPFATYDELQRVHGGQDYDTLKKYDIKNLAHFKDLELLLRSAKPSLSKSYVIDLISDLTDNGMFRFVSYKTLYKHPTWHDTFFTEEEVKPIGSLPAHIVELSPKEKVNFIDMNKDIYIQDYDFLMSVANFMKTLSDKVSDVDIYYSFSGTHYYSTESASTSLLSPMLKILIIEND